nr:unnamed protein product [Digitaria exilis]
MPLMDLNGELFAWQSSYLLAKQVEHLSLTGVPDLGDMICDGGSSSGPRILPGHHDPFLRRTHTMVPGEVSPTPQQPPSPFPPSRLPPNPNRRSSPPPRDLATIQLPEGAGIQRRTLPRRRPPRDFVRPRSRALAPPRRALARTRLRAASGSFLLFSGAPRAPFLLVLLLLLPPAPAGAGGRGLRGVSGSLPVKRETEESGGEAITRVRGPARREMESPERNVWAEPGAGRRARRNYRPPAPPATRRRLGGEGADSPRGVTALGEAGSDFWYVFRRPRRFSSYVVPASPRSVFISHDLSTPLVLRPPPNSATAPRMRIRPRSPRRMIAVRLPRRHHHPQSHAPPSVREKRIGDSILSPARPRSEIAAFPSSNRSPSTERRRRPSPSSSLLLREAFARRRW